jgi:hypothetical protein
LTPPKLRIGVGFVHFGQVIEPALRRDVSALKDLDQRIHDDPDRIVGIGGDRLVGFVASRNGAEGEIGKRRHSGSMRKPSGVPRRLQQKFGVEGRQLRNESQRRLDLLDFACWLAVLLDDPDDVGVVIYAGDLERFAVSIINMHREVFDKERMAL